MKVQLRFAPGVRLSKSTSLSPGWNAGLALAPTILKLPAPLVKPQTMFVSVQPGLGV
jgi:hypothetical protein